MRRTEHAGVAFEDAEEREELRGLVPRNHAREERSAERLRPSLDHADEHGEGEEVRGGAHEVSKHGDQQVDGQPANTAVLAPILAATMPNRKAHGMPMNCVISSAVIIALSGRPICVP